MLFLGATCYTPSPFTSKNVIWSSKKRGILYPTTYLKNNVVNNRPCFYRGIVGERSALRLSADSYQFITLGYYIDLRNVSFSITAWIYLNSNRSLMTIFAQCNVTSKSNCLFSRVNSGKLQFGFYDSDTLATKVMNIDCWYHVAFIYNDLSKTQTVYLNGIEDSRATARVYSGVPANITIGWRDMLNPGYFDGLIDRISVLDRLMTADQVLEEATLSAYYSFNNLIETDSRPNQINASSDNVFLTQGYSAQGLGFQSPPDHGYFQVNGFLFLGVAKYSYSFSFWILSDHFPTAATILYITTEDGRCLFTLGFTMDETIIAQSFAGDFRQIIGPRLLPHKWTHIALTYGDGDELKLYQDGLLSGSTGPFKSMINNSPVTLTLGFDQFQTNCPFNPIIPGPLVVVIDEFRIFSRCLTAAENLVIMQLH